MEQYFLYLQQALFAERQFYFLILLFSALTSFYSLFSTNKKRGLLDIFCQFAVRALFLFCVTFLYFTAARHFFPNITGLFFVDAALVVGLYMIFFLLFTKPDKREPEIRWRITGWPTGEAEFEENGDWKKQPILAINERDYAFRTAAPYIKLFREMVRRGCVDDETLKWLGNLQMVKAFQDHQRAAQGLPLDDEVSPEFPSTPTVPEKVTGANIPMSQPVSASAPAIEVQPPQSSAIPTDTRGPQTTQLKLKRSQREAAFGKIIFMLDARMELTPEDQALVNKYKLGGHVVYESTARQKHAEAAKAHLESTRDQPSLFASPSKQALGVGKTLFRLARAGASAAVTAMSLRVTIASPTQGVHVECKSMNELVDAENAIVEAAQNLKGYLANASSFDGREDIIDL